MRHIPRGFTASDGLMHRRLFLLPLGRYHGGGASVSSPSFMVPPRMPTNIGSRRETAR